MQPHSLITIANIGAVDSGKSTIIGRLLFHLKPELKKVENWHEYTDGLEIERRENKTLSVGHQYCDLDNHRIHFKDDPGHSDLVGQTISGLVSADIIFYVLKANSWDSETLKWHHHLLDWLGVSTTYYLLNQCDQLNWNKLKIDQEKEILVEAGCDPNKLFIVSGKTGEGLIKENPLQETSFIEELRKKISTIPTNGSNIENFKSSKVDILVWDFNRLQEHSPLTIHGNFKEINVKKWEFMNTTGPLHFLRASIPELETIEDQLLVLSQNGDIIGLAKGTDSTSPKLKF